MRQLIEYVGQLVFVADNQCCLTWGKGEGRPSIGRHEVPLHES